MQNPNRLNFINDHKNRGTINDTNLSLDDRLKVLSATRVDGISEFDRLFNEAVERQQKEKMSRMGYNIEDKATKSQVIEDTMFADLDKELGF